MAWTRSEFLPEVKYEKNGQISISELANDIVLKLPSKRFKDNVHFESIAGRVFLQVWPKWEEHFSPTTRKQFFRLIVRHVRRIGGIELSDDNRSNKNIIKIDDRRQDLAEQPSPDSESPGTG